MGRLLVKQSDVTFVIMKRRTRLEQISPALPLLAEVTRSLDHNTTRQHGRVLSRICAGSLSFMMRNLPEILLHARKALDFSHGLGHKPTLVRLINHSGTRRVQRNTKGYLVHPPRPSQHADRVILGY